MKKITFILAAVLIASMSFGQKSLIDKKSKTNSLSSKKQFEQSITSKTSAKSAKAVGTTIFSSDFSDPDQWIISNEAGNSDDWVIGTTGPSNSSYMLPIESTTAANGFALFDSDNLCSGNQNADLTTYSFDCSAYANVHIQFETFYKRYDEDGVFVQVSNNGTTWTDFEVFAEYVQQDESTNPEIIDIDISSVAGNAAPVWIRFKFLSPSSGCDFAWMIDDVLVYEYECELVSIPYLENFTGITTGELPDCWAQNNTNWSVVETSNANGISPELRFNWDPVTTTPNVIYLPKMDATEKSNLTMSFLNYVNWYNGSFDIKLGYTIDNGDTWNIAWEKNNITADIDAEMTFIDLSFLDGEIFQLSFAFHGNTNEINTWSIDNISIYETQTIPFMEDFTGVPNYTLPDGWNQSNAFSFVSPQATAGGSSPQLLVVSDPAISGENIVYLPTIDATTNSNLTMSFLHRIYYNTYDFDLRIYYTIDNGETWSTAWEKTNNAASIDAERIFIDLSAVDGEVFQLAFVLNGYNDDLAWEIDNIIIYEPFALPFMEDFTGVPNNTLPVCWDQSHPYSYVTSSSNANGLSPELMVNHEPGMNGEIKVDLPKMDATTNSNISMSFLHNAYYSSAPFDLRLDYSIDNGETWSIAWLKSNNTTNIDPETVFIDLSSYVGNEIFQLAFVLNVTSSDDLQWYIDNISIYEPFALPFIEDFTGVPNNTLPDCWNQFNTNSYVTSSSNASGTSPELMVYCDPAITGENIVYLPTIDATTSSSITMTFLHQVYYNTYDFDLRIDYTIDNGQTWNTAWEKTNNTANIDAEEILIDLSAVDGEVFQLAFVLNGYNDDLAWNIDNISITESIENVINQIDVDSDVNDVFLCVGDNEATALAALAPQMKINDTNGGEYIVDLTWTIASYDGNTSDAYNATGTFTLPTGVGQTTIPTPLEVTAIVTVNDPLVITFDFETEYCLGSTPGALPTTSVNNITGTWSPATIITSTLGETDYTFTPDAGECTDLPFLTISVTVADIPVVTCSDNFTITENGIVTLSGGIPAGGIYSGTGVTGNSFDPSSLTNGDYTITYTYPGLGCSNSCDFIITVNISSGINSNETAEISIYPNPNNGMFNISFGNVNGEVYYQIYDTKGSIIVNKNIHPNGDTIEEVSLNLISGVYFVRIITETQTLVQKLIIE